MCNEQPYLHNSSYIFLCLSVILIIIVFCTSPTALKNKPDFLFDTSNSRLPCYIDLFLGYSICFFYKGNFLYWTSQHTGFFRKIECNEQNYMFFFIRLKYVSFSYFHSELKKLKIIEVWFILWVTVRKCSHRASSSSSFISNLLWFGNFTNFFFVFAHYNYLAI